MTHFATRADLAALEARLTRRFACAMVAHALTLIGARSKQPAYFGERRAGPKPAPEPESGGRSAWRKETSCKCQTKTCSHR